MVNTPPISPIESVTLCGKAIFIMSLSTSDFLFSPTEVVLTCGGAFLSLPGLPLFCPNYSEITIRS